MLAVSADLIRPFELFRTPFPEKCVAGRKCARNLELQRRRDASNRSDLPDSDDYTMRRSIGLLLVLTSVNAAFDCKIQIENQQFDLNPVELPLLRSPDSIRPFHTALTTIPSMTLVKRSAFVH